MKKFGVVLLLVLTVCVGTGQTTQVFLDFEVGIEGAGSGQNAVGAESVFNDPNDHSWAGKQTEWNTQVYGGLKWEGSNSTFGYSSVNWLTQTPQYAQKTYLHTQSVARAQYLYGYGNAHSGNEYGTFGGMQYMHAALANGGKFILDGGWFSGYWCSLYGIQGAWLSASSISIEGFLNGSSKGSLMLSLDPKNWKFLDTSVWGAIDTFTITLGSPVTNTPWAPYGGANASFLRLDDLSYRQVPEPATIALLTCGAASLVSFRRKHR